MLTSKSRILPSTFYSDTVSRSRIRRQCLVELKEEPVPVSEDFGSIRVLMKYFPHMVLQTRKDLVHLRVVPSIKKRNPSTRLDECPSQP